MVQDQFLLRSLDYFLIDTATADQPEDLDFPLLSNPVSPSDCLKVVLRIPVAVEDYNTVSSLEVDSQTSRLGGQKKTEIMKGGDTLNSEREGRKNTLNPESGDGRTH